MQYLVSVLSDSTELASEEEMTAIDAFNAQLVADGHWVFAGGLGAPLAATVVDARAGQPVITDGPFIETKEFVAGFWILRADDLDIALELASAGSKACHRRVEVRPFLSEPT